MKQNLSLQHLILQTQKHKHFERRYKFKVCMTKRPEVKKKRVIYKKFLYTFYLFY